MTDVAATMQAKHRPRTHAVPLVALLLLLQVLCGLAMLPASSAGGAGTGEFVDNGDGTWTVTYAATTDTTFDSGAAGAILHTDPMLSVGHADTMSTRRNALVSLDLDAVAFPTNATIVAASLSLTRISGSADVHAWTLLQNDWFVEEANWNQRRAGLAWSSGGAMGSHDSGGLADRLQTIGDETEVSLDLTRTLRLGQHRQITGQGPVVSTLLTAGPSVEDAEITFASANGASPPLWSITVRWSNPSTPSSAPSWIDVAPKHGVADADASLDLTGTIRSDRGTTISAAVSWAVDRGSIDASGRFSPTTWAITTVNASGAGISDEAEVWVRPGNPLSLAMAEENISITVDDVRRIIAHGIDQHGNPVTGLPIGWTASDGLINETGFYTPTSLGTHTVAASWGQHVAVSNVTVGVGSAHRVLLPQSFEARAGIGTQIPATVEDRMGNTLPLSAAAGLDWTVERGSIDSAGYYVGDEIGTWQINVTSGVGAAGTGWVSVGPGLVNSLEIISPTSVIYADQTVPLDLRWHDRVGNNVSVLLPLENWSAETGQFRVQDDMVEWLPSQPGVWRISAHAEGVEAWIDIEVIRGDIAEVWIDAEHLILSADDTADLHLMAEDIRGNLWPIAAEWRVIEPEGRGTLVTDGEGTRFEAGPVGIWTLEATHVDSAGNRLATLELEVRTGRLARIVLPGDGETHSADDAIDLSPLLTDADGNTIDEVMLNWTIDGVDRTPQMRMADGVWLPTETGDHVIEASAAGRTARARIHIIQGEPHHLRLSTDLVQNGVTRSGEAFQITALAVDLDGNEAPWPVEWVLPDNALEIEETAWVGVYLARGLGEGVWEIEAHNGTAWGGMTLQVKIGEARSLRISDHSGGGDQGDGLSITVQLVDHGGNPLPMQSTKVRFDTEVGSVRHDGGPHWTLNMDAPGEAQSVRIEYEGFHAETFVDVDPTGIDRLTGTQGGQMLLGGFIAAGLLIGLLMWIVRRNEEVEPHWDDEFDWEPETSAPAMPIVVEAAPALTPVRESSRTARRRRAHRLQQERIRAMESATAELQTQPVVQETAAAVQQQAVLLAMHGTVQGQTGWYQTAAGEAQYWQVDANGEWSRVS